MVLDLRQSLTGANSLCGGDAYGDRQQRQSKRQASKACHEATPFLALARGSGRIWQCIYLDPAIWLDVSCGVYTAVAPIIPATRDSAAVNLSNPFGCLLYPAGQTTRSAQALQIAAIGND